MKLALDIVNINFVSINKQKTKDFKGRIINTAAYTNFKNICYWMAREINLPKQVYWDTNVESNRLLIEAAKKHGIKRYIMTSTCGVHGHITNPPANENAVIAPRDYYQVTKYEGEKLAKELCTKYEIPFVVVRPPIKG